MSQFLASLGIEIPFIILWLVVLSRINRNGREKRAQKVVFKMMIAGALSTLPTTLAYEITPFRFIRGYGIFLDHFLVVGITEEFVKFLTFVVMTRVLKSIREPHDGVIQGAAVGVGFALAENIMYGYRYGPAITLLRSLIIEFHVLSGAIWGFAWAAMIFENAGKKVTGGRGRVFMMVIAASLLHGIHNTLCETASSFGAAVPLFFVLMIALLVLSIRALKWMRERSPYHRFPYRQARTAIFYIRTGLKRDPGNRTLLRRLAVYQISAGMYREAVRGLTALVDKGPAPPELRALLGVALTGCRRSVEGLGMIHEAMDELPSERMSVLEQELGNIIRDSRVRGPVLLQFSKPESGLNEWAERRERLRRWNEPRVVHELPEPPARAVSAR